MQAQPRAGLSHSSAAVPPPNPSTGLCRETAVFFPGGSTTLSCTSQHGYLYVGESSALSITSPHTRSIPIPVTGMSWCLPIPVILAPRLPRPNLRARMLFGGEEAGFTPRIPVTFLVGPMGKGQWGRVVPAVAAYCSNICIAGTSAENLSESFTLFPYQERQLPPFLPWWILSNKDERRYWANSAPTPVKTSTTLPSPSCYHDILRCFTAWSCLWLWEEPSGI